MALTMRVPGLTCRHAVRVVSARLRDVPGVESVEVDGPAGWVVVRGPARRPAGPGSVGAGRLPA